MKDSKSFLLSGIIIVAVVASYGLWRQNVRDDAFNKNQACLQHKSEIESTLEAESSEETWVSELDEIFYSPVQNDCFYTLKQRLGTLNSHWKSGGDNIVFLKVMQYGVVRDYGRFTSYHEEVAGITWAGLIKKLKGD